MINTNDIYVLIEIIKKKENKETLTPEEDNKLKEYYKYYFAKSKDEIRLTKKGTQLYDVELLEFMYRNVDTTNLVIEQRREIESFLIKQNLKVLMNIIRKKEEQEDLSRSELNKLEKLYNLFPNANNDMMQLFDVMYNFAKKKGITQDDQIEFNLFRALKLNKNKTLRLSDLYKFVYQDIYSPEQIEANISNPEEMKNFFEKINGCALEETVSSMDISSINPNDLSTVKIDYGTEIDPMLLIKSITPVPLIDPKKTGVSEMTFIIFSDLHLDQNCYIKDNHGEMEIDPIRLRQNLTAFSRFKSALIDALGGISGIIYTGDILDAFFDRNKGISTKRTANKLARAIISYERQAREILYMNQASIEAGDTAFPETIPSLSRGGVATGAEPGFVAYLAGNHDMRLGRSKFNRIMRLFEKKLANPKEINLGNGSARIKIGDAFISLMHHNSLDWGLTSDEDKQTRITRNKVTFRFEEYFEICKAYYGEPGSPERTKFEQEFQAAKAENPELDSVYFLMNKVNTQMKEQNPDLYYYYLPYIIPNSNNFSYANVQEDNKGIKIKKNMEFFRNFIVMDENGNLKIREKGPNQQIKPTIDVFKIFIESEDTISYATRLESAVQELNERENVKATGKVYRYDVIPQFGRNDAYAPKFISLAHFHSALSNEKKDGTGGRTKSHSLSRGTGKDKRFFLHAAVQQDQGMVQKPDTGFTRLSAIAYTLRFNEDKLLEICVTPYKWQTNINGQLVPNIKEGETITFRSR